MYLYSMFNNKQTVYCIAEDLPVCALLESCVGLLKLLWANS